MGLDATVYCNCFETGKLKQPPPIPDRVYVTDDGSLNYRCDDLDQTMMFDRWLSNQACEHADGVLLHQYLGNIARVGFVRHELEREPSRFRILLDRVVCDGVHCGDWLDFEDVLLVEAEVQSLETFVVLDLNEQPRLDEFRVQMEELIDAAKLARKPISF